MDSHFLSYNVTPTSLKYLNGKLKRSIDIAGAAIGIVLGFPIFGLATLIVKFIDKVPALFTQERLGFRGKPFVILKLRTLPIAETDNIIVNASQISRIPEHKTTFTGRFWRVTSIDEIIQFWQVLKGDMSLVGHRPFPFHYLPYLAGIEGMNQEKLDHYLRVVSQYKPGMSSLSSVQGRDDLTLHEKFLYDLMYANKASFWYDVRLIFQTIYVVLTCQGAK